MSVIAYSMNEFLIFTILGKDIKIHIHVDWLLESLGLPKNKCLKQLSIYLKQTKYILKEKSVGSCI